MSQRTNRNRSAKLLPRPIRLHLPPLEVRLVPHTGVTLFSDGLTPNAGLTGIVRGPDGNFWFTEFAASRVARVTPTGTITEFSTGISDGSGPLNITVGPDN